MKKLLCVALIVGVSPSFAYILKDAKNISGTQTMIATCQNFDNSSSDVICMVKRKEMSAGQWGPWIITGKKGTFKTFEAALSECCASNSKK